MSHQNEGSPRITEAVCAEAHANTAVLCHAARNSSQAVGMTFPARERTCPTAKNSYSSNRQAG
jgi:hypothetical protein